jgi:AbrB family looped-hinge helix DNA binding protein
VGSAVTRLSSKGQIVIPAEIRRRLRLSPGDELRIAVGAEGEPMLVLERLSSGEVQRRIERGYSWLERDGADPVETLHATRRAAHAGEARRR